MPKHEQTWQPATRYGLLGPEEREALATGAAEATETIDLTQVELEPGVRLEVTLVDVGGRYVFEQFIGRGGMGEVWRVRDTRLDALVAMKILGARFTDNAGALRRFEDEARLTARLQHPGIVPVHDLGRLQDGRCFYTMRRIEGDSLRSWVPAVGPSLDPGELRRRVGIFMRACEAVAFAHAAGVVHRDIKPDNIVVGHHGEVTVVDWGIALLLVDRARRGAAGTPAYMAPEQLGDPDKIGPTADVWALGVTLHELLSGTKPRRGELPSGTPVELRRLVADCLRREPSERPPHGGAVVGELQRWLDGVRRRERALVLVAEADAKEAEISELLSRARSLEADAAERLSDVPGWAPAEDKQPGWALQDQAAQARGRAELAQVERIQLLNASLTHRRDLPEARERLAAWYRKEHVEAEQSGRSAEAAAVMLRSFDDGQHAAYLAGLARLSIDTEPSGARVEVLRFEERGRRLEPVPTGQVGTTPAVFALSHGSYLLRLEHPDCEPVVYPVLLGREEEWELVPPGSDESVPVWLPPRGSIGEDECFVPAGWSIVGWAEAEANAVQRRRHWVDDAVFQRTPVTHGDWLAFLDDLVSQGLEGQALDCQPRPSQGDSRVSGFYAFDGVRFSLKPDAKGDLWSAEWPVMYVDHGSMLRYSAWLSAQSSQRWRLPFEDEWERAARGADGRIYPWGGFIDPPMAAVRGSGEGRVLPREVGSYPTDTSVFGVRDLVGGIREMCSVRWPPATGAYRGRGFPVVKGASWNAHVGLALTYGRTFMDPMLRGAAVGLRVVRSVERETYQPS